MIYKAIGCLGFSVVHLFDIGSLKRVPVAKPLTWILSSGLLVYALAVVWLQSGKLPLPTSPTWLGWALLSISFLLVLGIVQEKFFFGRMFDGYYSYRQETPMLVPNQRSINTFITSIKQARAQNLT